ncbi:MAG: LacI family DNA-binding transcriptional regulator [Victivallaceae bacterium]
MTKRKLTIKDFAKQLGVSTATVSRAFSEKGRISDKTRQEIIAKAQELGYRANIHARSLTSRNSNVIALFFPAIGHEEPDYFITEILLGINQTLRKSRKTLQIHPFPLDASAEELELYAEYILNDSFEGIIIVAGAKGSNHLVNTAKAGGVPYAIIGHMSGINENSVLFNNEYGAFLAGKYFKDTGRKHPAYVGGHLDKRKKTGFQDGFGAEPGTIVFAEGGNSFRHGGMALDNLQKTNPEVDCVLCANDVLAIGFIKAAITKNIRVPQDIAVIGFDDIRPARYFNPALSSISLKLFELGECAVKILLQAIAEEQPVNSETIECDLILRQSS